MNTILNLFYITGLLLLKGSRISSTDEAGFTMLGDMIINSKVSNGGIQNSGRNSKTYRWPAGVVPYKIESSFSAEEKTSIEEAIESLNNDLEGCVNIRQALSSDEDFIKFVNYDDGCYSLVGRTENIRRGIQTGSQSTFKEVDVCQDLLLPTK